MTNAQSRSGRRRGAWLVAGVVLAIAVPLVIVPLLRGRDASPSEPAAPPANAPAETAGAPTPPPVTRESAVASERPPAAEPPPPAAPASAEPARASRWVEIVEAETESPIADAEVFWRQADGDSWDRRAFRMLVEDPTSRRGRSDGGGRLAVEWPEDAPVLVLARAPGRAGGAIVRPPESSDVVARVPLVRDWDVVVEVVESSGAPAAGVMVEFRESRERNTHSNNTPTDEKGRVVFDHVGLRSSGEGEKERLALDVTVRLPLLEPPTRRIDLDVPPVEPIRFVLPALGAVAVRVLDAKRAPAKDGTDVELRVVKPGESREPSPFSGTARYSEKRPTRGGVAAFERVDLGADVDVRVPGPSSEAVAAAFGPGPAAAGETVEMTLVLGAEAPVLAFRAVDASGAPLAREKLEIESTMRSSHIANSDSSTLTTDENGVFEHALASTYVDGDKRTLHVTAREKSIGAFVDLSRAFEAGPNDMGDLPLVPPPLLVAGRVVDDAGKPVAGATVQVELPVRDEADPDGVWYWNDVDSGSVKPTDSDGRFESRGYSSERTVRATARTEWLRSAPAEVPVGTDDLVLALSGIGSVVGSVRLEAGVEASALDARLSPARAAEDGKRSQASVDAERGAMSETGEFTFEDLLPGTYRFALRLAREDSDAEPLVAFDGIDVAAGRATRDPRLQGIDLRSRLRAARLTLVPPPGHEGALHGNATVRPSGDPDAPLQWTWFQSSPVTIVFASEAVDVQVAAAGFRIVRLANVRGDREVPLEPALEVRLALADAVDVPRPPLYVKAALVPADGDVTPDFGGNAFDETREIRCASPGVGRMKVVWILERRAGGSASASTIDVAPEQFVEVREDADGPQRFVLTATTEALEKATARRP